MNIINIALGVDSQPCSSITLGRRGENEVTQVVVDFSSWVEEFGAGVITLLAMRSQDTSAYPVVLSLDGNTATWDVTSTDTAYKGSGRAEYIYTVGEQIAKSVVFNTVVMQDIGEPSETPPDPYEDWLERLTELGAETQANAEAAQQSAENAEQSAQEAAQEAANAEGYAEQAGESASAAQSAKAASESARDKAQAAQASAEASATAASGSAASASASATAAGASATTASTAAGQAEAAKTAAQAAQSAAEDAAADAQQAAQQAHVEYEQLSGEVDDLSDEVAQQKSAFEAHEQYAEETYAKQDGTYEDLTAGNAYELLSDRGDTNQQPYLFRQTGGDSSAYNREQLKKIVGGTVAWNQFVEPESISSTRTVDGITFTNNGDGSVTIDGVATARSNFSFLNVSTANGTLKQDHVYFLKACPLGGSRSTYYGGVAGLHADLGGGGIWKYTYTFQNSSLRIDYYPDATFTNAIVKAQYIDLTQMFGTTIADYIYSLEQSTAGAGVAFFRKLFPNDYYDYNPGELMSVEGVSAHETVGFNQWDGTADSIGKSIAADGSLQNSSNYCASDYIRVLPNTTYYLKNVAPSANARTMFCYGYDKSPISAVGLSGAQNVPASGLVTTVDGTHFVRIVRFASTAEYGINLSDPARNGTYEPYKKRTYPLDSSLTLRGIPKLDSNNRLYYDGDTYEPDGTVTRKYGIVDLGTLNFGAASAYGSVFRTGAPLTDAITDNPSVGRLVDCRCVELEHSRYVADAAAQAVANTYGIRYNNIYVCFSESKTKAEVLAALSGILLVYPLLTPTTETADPYRELEICDRDGTEEFVSTSIVPVGHETFYPVNVFDYIDRLTEPDADMIADSVIAANKYFSVGNRLFLSTASIAAGAMIIPGTNCTETSLAAALNALNA